MLVKMVRGSLVQKQAWCSEATISAKISDHINRTVAGGVQEGNERKEPGVYPGWSPRCQEGP